MLAHGLAMRSLVVVLEVLALVSPSVGDQLVPLHVLGLRMMLVLVGAFVVLVSSEIDLQFALSLAVLKVLAVLRLVEDQLQP